MIAMMLAAAKLPAFTCDMIRVHDGDAPYGADRAKRSAWPVFRRRTSKAPDSVAA